MKKKINLLQLIVICTIAVFSGLVCCGLTSCKNTTFPWEKDSTKLEQTVDSLVQLGIEEAINPTFYSVDEVMEIRSMAEEGRTIDSLFNTLSDKEISDVATVLIKKYGNCKKKCIVDEYFSHADIYKNLPKQAATESDPPSESSSAATNDRHTLPFSTEYQYSTDTVDGKPVKVQTKTEKSYVRD